MAIFNLGSINIDHVYQVDHLPAPGETLAATSLSTGLGGKGANQSIAIARAGGTVSHIGAVGPEGAPWVDMIAKAGAATGDVATIDTETGHANIYVETGEGAENSIVLFEGANRKVPLNTVKEALSRAHPGDWLLLQNETNAGLEAAQIAKEKGLKLAYAAAPFDAKAVATLLPYLDLLSVNEGEEAELIEALPAVSLNAVPRLVTYGPKGAALIEGQIRTPVRAFSVTPVDTTGAGDTFLGYALAGMDQGDLPATWLRRASAAAALQVTRMGAAKAIPDASDVEAFLAQSGH